MSTRIVKCEWVSDECAMTLFFVGVFAFLVVVLSLKMIGASVGNAMQRATPPSTETITSAAMAAVKRHDSYATVALLGTELVVDGRRWNLGALIDQCSRMTSDSPWRELVERAADQFMRGDDSSRPDGGSTSAVKASGATRRGSNEGAEEIVDGVDARAASEGAGVKRRSARDDADGVERADPRDGDDGSELDTELEELRADVLAAVHPLPLLVDDPNAGLVDDRVPGARFVYVVPVGNRAPLLKPGALDEFDITLGELRAAAVRNAALTRESLELAPVKRGFDMMTNHREDPFAAALLLDTAFWRSLVEQHGPMLAVATAPTRILYGPDSVQMRISMTAIVASAPTIEDQICMRAIVRFDGERWEMATVDNLVVDDEQRAHLAGTERDDALMN